MESITSAVGIDVSLAHLDIRIEGKKPFKVKNTTECIAAFASTLPAGSLIALERSGGYERLAVNLLRAAGHDVRPFNPLAVKRFGQSMGRKAKTDPLDAKTLSDAGRTLPAPRVKSEERESLCDHARHLHRLKTDLAKVKKRLQRPGLADCLVASLRRELAFLEGEVKAMHAEFAVRTKASVCAQDYELALSVPGVGPVTAGAVVAELPDDLSDLSPAQIASYAGLAPLDNSSGKCDGARRIVRGNIRLKAALYMPAMRAATQDEWAKTVYRRLRDNGKSHQSAVVAVMRRLLMRIVAVLKRRTPWQGVLKKP